MSGSSLHATTHALFAHEVEPNVSNILVFQAELEQLGKCRSKGVRL
jgi:hypothetical protein